MKLESSFCYAGSKEVYVVLSIKCNVIFKMNLKRLLDVIAEV